MKLIDQYYNDGFKNIHGWCNNELYNILNLLDKAEINKNGGCLEIGIHHGKFYCLLNSLVDEKETSIAIDIFSNQHLNIDSSGYGNLEIFKDNLVKYDVHKGKNTKILNFDSTDIKLCKELEKYAGCFKLISIDGGHTAEHTISDLKLANTMINNEGIVFIDDILHPHWLGVLEGTVKFLEHKPTLVPFALGSNKLLLCKLSYHSYYYGLFSRSSLRKDEKMFFGHKIIICHHHFEN